MCLLTESYLRRFLLDLPFFCCPHTSLQIREWRQLQHFTETWGHRGDKTDKALHMVHYTFNVQKVIKMGDKFIISQFSSKCSQAVSSLCMGSMMCISVIKPALKISQSC